MNSASKSTKDGQESTQVSLPCTCYEWNEVLRKNKLHRPAVDCEMDCAQCGWNPSIAKERVRKMKKEYHDKSIFQPTFAIETDQDGDM